MLTIGIKVHPFSAAISRMAMRLGLLSQSLEDSVAATDIVEKYLLLLEECTPKQSGRASRSWSIKTKTKKTITFQNTATSLDGYNYPNVLEYGSDPGRGIWKKPGPRTVLAASSTGVMRIFSSQAPGGISKIVNARLNTQDLNQQVMSIIRSKVTV